MTSALAVGLGTGAIAAAGLGFGAYQIQDGIGERNPNDVCVYPDSNKMGVNALRMKGTFDMLGVRGYWDGEQTS